MQTNILEHHSPYLMGIGSKSYLNQKNKKKFLQERHTWSSLTFVSNIYGNVFLSWIFMSFAMIWQLLYGKHIMEVLCDFRRVLRITYVRHSKSILSFFFFSNDTQVIWSMHSFHYRNVIENCILLPFGKCLSKRTNKIQKWMVKKNTIEHEPTKWKLIFIDCGFG